MKILFITLLTMVAMPAIASQNYRTSAHAWYNEQGEVEISSKLIYARQSSSPVSSHTQSATDTLPAAQLFSLNSARLIAPSQSLQALARRLQSIPHPQTVLLTGHTDSSGSAAHNLTLSGQRAQSIRQYLTGLAPQHHYSATGRGEAQPVADNTTRAGREKNRRVTVAMSTQGTHK
jgi:outer membrane protein OmpA-like peptidoglycan-associated protein